MTTNILLTLIAVSIIYVIFLWVRCRHLTKEIEAYDFDQKAWEESRFLINNAILGKELRENYVIIVPKGSAYSVRICRVVEKDNTTIHMDYVVKEFCYNPEDKEDEEYAMLCAEELKEAIEYDWKIKNYYEG